jgi:hypothetical protein
MILQTLWTVPLAALALVGAPLIAAQSPAQKPAAATSLPWDARSVEHLLNRAGFGATPADIDAGLALGREVFLAKLFECFAPDSAAFEVVEAERPTLEQQDLLLDLDERLCALEIEDPEVAQLVKLRMYAGLSTVEAGKVLGMSRKVAYANWEFVRSWFAITLPQASY